jgi:outer membrane protein TolC
MIVSLLVCGVSLGQSTTSVSQAVERAVRLHPMLSVAQADVQGAKARAAMLEVPYVPQVSLNAVGTAGEGAMTFASTVMPINYWRTERGSSGVLNASLMWRPWSFGREAAARGIGREEVLSAEETLAVVRQNVALSVRLAFAEALLRRETVEANKAAVESAREVERVTREQYEAGKLPEAFLFRAAADTAEMERELAMAEAEAASALAMLRETMGMDQVEMFALGDWDIPLEAPASLAEALAQSEARPEIAAIRHAREGQELRARLAELSTRPDLALMVMGDWMGTRGMAGETGSKVGLVVSFPLADGGERRATRGEARAMAGKMDAEMRSIRLAVEAEVAAAWAAWQAQPAVSRAARAGLESSSEAYRVALLRYQEGKAILAEVTDARARLVAAQRSIAEAEAYARTAWSKLQRAMGRD